MDAQPFGCVLSPLLLLVLMPPAAHAAHLATSAHGFSEPFPVTWEVIGVLQVSRRHRALVSPGFQWRSRAGCSRQLSYSHHFAAICPPSPCTPNTQRPQEPPCPGGEICTAEEKRCPEVSSSF